MKTTDRICVAVGAMSLAIGTWSAIEGEGRIRIASEVVKKTEQAKSSDDENFLALSVSNKDMAERAKSGRAVLAEGGLPSLSELRAVTNERTKPNEFRDIAESYFARSDGYAALIASAQADRKYGWRLLGAGSGLALAGACVFCAGLISGLRRRSP